MTEIYYKVIEEFANRKSKDIRPQYARILSSLKKGQIINQKKFIDQHIGEFTLKKDRKATQGAVYHAFVEAKRLGMIIKFTPKEAGIA